MTSVLNNIVNNNIRGTTPDDRNKWYYMILLIVIIIFFLLYVKVDFSINNNRQDNHTETTIPKTTQASSSGDIFHTKITKVSSSLQDQHDELEQQYYS